MLTDTHCHLDFDWFDEDREAVLGRALDAGLRRLLVPALDHGSSADAIALAEGHGAIYAAVGMHPNSARKWMARSLDRFREIADHSKVVAIGEIGLDYYRDRAPHDLQMHVFQEQLGLAAELGLPVVIHNREATEDVLGVLEVWQRQLSGAGSPLAERPGVLHSFSGDESGAQRALEANFYLGVTGPVTFQNAAGLQTLVRDLPLERLLIETDAPYLTPHPHRGKRNEPAHVLLVAEKIAELKGIELETVLRTTYDNAARLFQWG